MRPRHAMGRVTHTGGVRGWGGVGVGLLVALPGPHESSRRLVGIQDEGNARARRAGEL